ncbi:hypothetical protein HWC97_gp23 [Flavobacterium phage vB_FspS_snusmum6-1]|uniref:Uncharacterized protein n=11 Tax=Caudoviricetes TaxID=2731619 RepID=A0A6B9LBA2_9CAUD|nr:hypothetical protein HWC88_gp23 [Flavobacterium phage vB_FspS_hattifnatt9-1]YP_009854884.1 hypothetical protein HWC91_gp29 [Flavobacterium phage vB_FspS_lillamy9-1]YP_009854956.1 hypothetical protein HWC92_gp28 [Flavobacterium phage vB_FspS_morran9-1]YP_009855306.1 hypothetical protein HWC97_gp23 [Flavobacterium phage vB_FspS_snusmum6-1]QHB39130.1 hypothetical protein lillamy92_gp029 [Flavobacterium phage vB_FspS_lillamy9-2]QHB39203.1 hypothetical protein lillamy93_gp029 [Flavobacterium pha
MTSKRFILSELYILIQTAEHNKDEYQLSKLLRIKKYIENEKV